MVIQTKTSVTPGYLEQFKPIDPNQEWMFVREGGWSQDIYHSGRNAYYITCDLRDGTWLMKSLDTTPLDFGDCFQSDLENTIREEIIAICVGAPINATAVDMAEVIYDALWDVGLGLEE